MIDFKHNLKTLFKQISKHYPEINEYDNYSFVEDYCKESEKPIKTKKYHFGYNSLKWIIYSLRSEIEQEKLERLFKNLIFQFFMLQKTQHDLQYNILSFPESFYYKKHLKTENRWESLMKKLEHTKIEPFPVIINPTGQNLTNKIFKTYNPEIIIGANNTQKSKKAIIFKANGYLATQHSEIIKNIYLELIKKEESWTGIAQENSFNLLICQESNFNEKDLFKIVKTHIEKIT
jgi:hypothetical protein